MTQEDKQLLLKDLCTRLPYGVKGLALGGRDDTISVLVPVEYPWVKTDTGLVCHLGTGQFKPYLRPMSSMTEEEFVEYHHIKYNKVTYRDNWKRIDVGKYHNVGIIPIDEYLDWLNAHHFDYRGLIEKDLALEAPEDMYNTK